MKEKNSGVKTGAAKKSFYRRHKNTIEAYLLIGVPLVWWIVFFAAAFIMAFVFSFTDMKRSIESITRFTLDNYALAFDKNSPLYDPAFFESLWVSVRWTIFTTIGANVFGLLVAYCLSRIPKGKRIFLVLLYWTALVSAVVGSEIKKKIFASDETGIMNAILLNFRLIDSPIEWFYREDTAFFALIFTSVFFGYSGKLLIYYSSILGIPEELYEAASLETDSQPRMFFAITLPLIRNAILINVVLSLMDGLKIIGPMQLITNGNPNNSTRSVVLLVYQLTRNSDMGTACAYSMMLFVVIMILTIVQFALNKRKEEISYE